MEARSPPSSETRVGVAAALQLITPSVWLRRVIAAALGSETAHTANAPVEQSMGLPRHRLSVRIRRGDALLLKARALARGMKSSTLRLRANSIPSPKSEPRSEAGTPCPQAGRVRTRSNYPEPALYSRYRRHTGWAGGFAKCPARLRGAPA